MSKKSDDSIERIFRQALTHYDTTYQESDWVKMEKMLNEEMNRRAAARLKRIKGTAYTLTGLTGLLIAVYFLAFRNPSASIAELNNSVTEVQATGDLEKKGNVKLEDPSAGLLSGEASSNAKEKPSEKEPAELGNKATEEDVEATRRNKELNRSSKKNPNVPLSQKAGDRRMEGKKNRQPLTEISGSAGNQSKQSVAADAPKVNAGNEVTDLEGSSAVENRDGNVVSGQKAAEAKNQFPQENGAPAATEPSKNETGKIATQATGGALISANPGQEKAEVPAASERSSSVVSDSTSNLSNNTLAVVPDSAVSSEMGQEEKHKMKPPYRFSAGVILAPEFSSTSLGDYSAPGASLGLRIGYQISNKFSINTGLIRSTKKYEGDGYDYTPRNPLYWQIRTNGVVPEEIDSKCLVYELPLGVQFDAIQTEKSRVFLSAAISSYFMTSQSYDYTFDSPNPGADTGWRSSRSESYWFDVGMLSAGYERYVHRSFAIGIEPYLKVSFGEIGWPNVKLFSGGAYVTFRYRFMSQRNIQ
ncbi:MAG TPA: hypothetical protein VFD46_03810 [Chryseolinea sp.]|nr:hypothetical protein [Chryseolinea sp.]